MVMMVMMMMMIIIIIVIITIIKINDSMWPYFMEKCLDHGDSPS